jgi:hypothetical protein
MTDRETEKSPIANPHAVRLSPAESGRGCAKRVWMCARAHPSTPASVQHFQRCGCGCEVPLPLPPFYMLSTPLSPLLVATRRMLRRWVWMQGREREYVKMHALLLHPGRCVPTPIRRHVRWRSHAIALKIVCSCITRRKDDGLKKMYGSFCRCHDHIPFYTHHGARNPQCNMCSTPFCNGQ